MAAIDTLTEAQVVEALKALAEARRSVEDVLAQQARSDAAPDGPTDFEQFMAIQKKAAIERRIADLESRLSALTSRALNHASEIAAQESNALAIEAGGASIPRLMVDAGVLSYSQASAADQVVGITDAMKAALRKAITQSLAGGLSRGELEARIRDVMGGDVSEARVERIVRTELGRAMEQQKAAHDEVMSDMGLNLVKRWITVGDDRVREDHAAIDGQERDLDDLFNVGEGATDATEPGGPGYEANAPGDPSLPASETVNCRCTVVRVPRAQALQPYIDKTPRGRAARIHPLVRQAASQR